MKTIKIYNSTSLIEVDDEDFERLSIFKWTLTGNGQGRVRRTVQKYPVTRAIPIANDVMRRYKVQFDHIDRNPLNNQKSNLRECSVTQNNRNRSKSKNTSSKYLGVSWSKRSGKWRAGIMLHGKTIHLGLYCDEILAARAYDATALALFKEFANLNFK